MKEQKSKFWTFIFALIPGAAQMYMGFMLRGLSLMACAVIIIMLVAFTGSVYLAFLFPLIWFYAFFDAINLRELSKEKFEAQLDEPFYTYIYPITKQSTPRIDFASQKLKITLGAVIIAIGAYALLWEILSLFGPWASNALYEALHRIMRYTPRIIISFGLIWIGIRLIRGKRKELNENEE